MVVKIENVFGRMILLFNGNGFESGDQKSAPAGVPMILGTCWAGVLLPGSLPFCQALPSSGTLMFPLPNSLRRFIAHITRPVTESSSNRPRHPPPRLRWRSTTLPSWDFSETSPPRKIFNQLPSTPALFSIFTKSYGPIASGNPF